MVAVFILEDALLDPCRWLMRTRHFHILKTRYPSGRTWENNCSSSDYLCISKE